MAQIDPLLEVKKESYTALEKEQKLKEEAGKLSEELEVVGQESEEAAVPWVIEVNRSMEKTDQAIKDTQAEYFEDASHKSFKTYIYSLAKLTYNLLKDHVEWPPNCTFYLGYDELKGIAVKVYTPKGNYARGFTPVKERKYDLNAVNVLIMQVENTLEEFFPKVNDAQTIESGLNPGGLKDSTDHQKA